MFYNKQGSFLEYKEFKILKEKFELKNLKKVQQKNLGFWGWQKMPDKIKHYKDIKEKELVQIPNGLRGLLPHKFNNQYGEVKYISFPEIINNFKGNELDLKQDKLVEKLLSENVGLAWASTGVGKTMITSKIIKQLNVRTLIVVPNLILMKQMQKDLKEIFGIKYKTLSGQKLKQKDCSEDIIIANIDTLVKQDREFFNGFDLTICDEVDTYLSSEKRLEIMGYSLTTKWIYGLTGTIKVNHTPDEIFKIYFGPRSELLLKNFTPTVQKVYTSFEYDLIDFKEMHLLKEALYYSEDRNNLIVDTIINTLGNSKGICFCEYIDHSKILKEKLEAKGIKVFLLIGEIKKEEREQVKKALKEYKGKSILIGSVKIIGRGFNLPELSKGYLTTAEKFTSNIEQYVGRIIRNHPDKKEVVWYDFVDNKCKFLLNQSYNRTKTYKKTFKNIKILDYNDRIDEFGL